MPTVRNQSTVVTDDEARRMTVAADVQMQEHFSGDWELEPWGLGFDVRKYISIALVDTDRDVPDALAYHDLRDGRPVGIVMAKTILDQGGPMFGPGGVAAALSHEYLEIRADAYCTKTGLNTVNGFLYWWEVCDACQAQDYSIDGVHVSDYVLPNWFNPEAPEGRRMTRLGSVWNPFDIAEGGYQVVSVPGAEKQIDAQTPPKLESFTIGTPTPKHGWRSLKRAGL